MLVHNKVRVILYPMLSWYQIMSTWDEVGGPCSLIELERENRVKTA